LGSIVLYRAGCELIRGAGQQACHRRDRAHQTYSRGRTRIDVIDCPVYLIYHKRLPHSSSTCAQQLSASHPPHFNTSPRNSNHVTLNPKRDYGLVTISTSQVCTPARSDRVPSQRRSLPPPPHRTLEKDHPRTYGDKFSVGINADVQMLGLPVGVHARPSPSMMQLHSSRNQISQVERQLTALLQKDVRNKEVVPQLQLHHGFVVAVVPYTPTLVQSEYIHTTPWANQRPVLPELILCCERVTRSSNESPPISRYDRAARLPSVVTEYRQIVSIYDV
jgi:hypothetical protein